MMHKLNIVIFVVCFIHIRESVADAAPVKAVAVLWPKGEPIAETAPIGIVEFLETQNLDGSYSVLIEGKLDQIFPANANHGFHIHEVANYSAGCVSAGPHYNPAKRNHGNIKNHESHRHVGDLGNVYSDKTGRVILNLKDSIIRLSSNDSYRVIGRPLIIHAKEDDLGLGENKESKETGSAGGRLACGTIHLL